MPYCHAILNSPSPCPRCAAGCALGGGKVARKACGEGRGQQRRALWWCATPCARKYLRRMRWRGEYGSSSIRRRQPRGIPPPRARETREGRKGRKWPEWFRKAGQAVRLRAGKQAKQRRK